MQFLTEWKYKFTSTESVNENQIINSNVRWGQYSDCEHETEW